MATICILEPSHWGRFRGGAECQTHFLAEHIARSGRHDVIFLARFVPEDTNGFTYPIRRYQGPACFSHLRWGQSADVFSIVDELKQIAPDVILQMQAGAYVGAGVHYARQAGIPHVWYIASDRDLEPAPPVGTNSPFRHLDRALFAWGIRHTSHIIAQTELQRERVRTFLGRDATAVIPNFHPAPPPADKDQHQFIVSWVANLKALKRPMLFANLARAFLDRKDTTFVMAGRSDGSAEAVAAIEAIRGLPNCRYVGELSLEDVNQLLEESHLFINTSEFEGFPNTFIQAWLRQVPVLSIAVDPDGLLNGAGLGRMSGDEAGLVRDVARLLDDAALRSDIGARARDHAIEHFSMKNADRVVEVLEAAIESTGRGR